MAGQMSAPLEATFENWNGAMLRLAGSVWHTPSSGLAEHLSQFPGNRALVQWKTKFLLEAVAKQGPAYQNTNYYYFFEN